MPEQVPREEQITLDSLWFLDVPAPVAAELSMPGTTCRAIPSVFQTRTRAYFWRSYKACNHHTFYQGTFEKSSFDLSPLQKNQIQWL